MVTIAEGTPKEVLAHLGKPIRIPVKKVTLIEFMCISLQAHFAHAA